MKRILIVDDEEFFRSILRELLEGNGHSCEEASDGVQALQALSMRHFDLVITDMVMPKMNGESLVKNMSENDRWNSIPVICVSGNLGLSADQFKKPVTVIEKPIKTELLMSVLRKLLFPQEYCSEPRG